MKLTIFAKIECIPSEDFQVKLMGVELCGFNSTSNCDGLSFNNGRRVKRSNYIVIYNQSYNYGLDSKLRE